MYEPEVVQCPGCPEWMERGDLCCATCWRRTPLRLRRATRGKRMRKNYPAYLAATLRIQLYLMESRV
jgi:hypothetical protein